MNSRMLRLTSAVASIFAAGPALAETVYDNTHPSIVYTGGWNHENSSTYVRAINGTLSESQNAGASAQLTFSGGKYISLVYTMHDNRWASDVYIDGTRVETLNTRTEYLNQRWQVMKTWPLDTELETHTIQVVTRGNSDGQSIHKAWSDVDAFIVDANAAVPGTTTLNGTYAPDSSLVSYAGNWTYSADTLGTRMQSGSPGNSVRFTFYGDMVRWNYYAASNRGIAELTLDGVALPDLDLYGPGENRFFKLSNLTPGMHTLTLTVSGRRNANATTNTVDVHGFRVGR